MSLVELVPDASHPITVAPTGRRVRVLVSDIVVADTTAALTLQESTYAAVHYVPLGDVDDSVLATSDTSTYCPYKGIASYYSVVTPDGEIADAGWTYPEAYDAVAEIRGHVAWYADKVEIALGDD